MRNSIFIVIIINLVMSSCTSKSDSNKTKEKLVSDSTTIRNEKAGFDTDGY